MPKISFCFQGYAYAEILTAKDIEGEDIDVSEMRGEELASKLELGELFIDLANHISQSHKNEIDIYDFMEEG